MTNIKFDRTSKITGTSNADQLVSAGQEQGRRPAGVPGGTERSPPATTGGRRSSGIEQRMPGLRPEYPGSRSTRTTPTVNVAGDDAAANSCLNYFRKLAKLRKSNPALIYGKYVLLDKDNPDVYAYTRELNGRKILVLLNFRDRVAAVNTGLDLSKATVLLGNYATASRDGKLPACTKLSFTSFDLPGVRTKRVLACRPPAPAPVKCWQPEAQNR